MVTNEDSTETSSNSSPQAPPAETPKVEEKPKQELKLPIDISKFKMPAFKMPEGGFAVLIKNKISEYQRVYKITKKPDRKEYSATVKASGLGIVVIGMVGFIIAMIVQIIGFAK